LVCRLALRRIHVVQRIKSFLRPIADILQSFAGLSACREIGQADGGLRKLNSAFQRIDAEVKRLSAGVGISSNISRQREGQLRAELEAQRTKVLKLKQERDEGIVIQREVENAQRNYDNIMQRLSVTTIESQATSSNVSLLTSASAPIEASFPKVFLNIALGLFVGGLLGVGVTLAAELRDRRVRDVEDVHELLGQHVIGVLPGPKSSRAGKVRALAAHQRLLGNSPSKPRAA
jgi:uncharacterized protein involved in exopolysaccharide biosynthesis